MELYISSLFIFVMLLAVAVLWQYQRGESHFSLLSPKKGDGFAALDDELHDLSHETTADRYFRFRNRFLQVYGLSIAADWLQGSFMYSIYKTTHRLSEPTIASLFATGFLFGGISATFVGLLADRFGRRRACLSYCALYAISCMTVLHGNTGVLFLGRALGGISTTLLFTSFETWMIAEYHRLGFSHSDAALSSIYGIMSTLNGFIAILSGVISQFLVHGSGSEMAPFLASIVCLVLASLLILQSWSENYAVSKETPATAVFSTEEYGSSGPGGLLATSFTACFFEGTMYIMIYCWPQSIASARLVTHKSGNPPFGLIFANLMCAMTLGSFCFTYITQHGNSLQISSQVTQILISVSATSLLLMVVADAESYRFLALCVFEFCLGAYFPSMAYMKGSLVSNTQRGKIYGLIRVPLNAFVVLSLATIQEGKESRDNRFMVCSGLLLSSVAAMARYGPQSGRSL